MNTVVKVICFSAVFLLLTGCVGNNNEEATTDASEEISATESAEEPSIGEGDEANMNKENEVSSEESALVEPDGSTSNTSDQKNEESLSQYPSEHIEYARVWLQLGANQDIDGLYVNKIPAGTLLNPDDETSGVYPEDVIQLAGSRLIDGSVTYSGNGDGTINVYPVPLRWDGEYPAGEEFYEEMISNTELVSVDVGEDEEVIRLIELLEIQE
ncbi:hypothetical protein [Planococcus salinus]|uniref:Lipoprotein n=1 Tax=Planococcus salinus TaxID=1848460 RepID=A0A3M8P5C4_9BACL|nr:hypothetical protein [Planococcus salinus]RNF38886.1 hypothetical protein EEX84_12260 [Planococcus salinus]